MAWTFVIIIGFHSTCFYANAQLHNSSISQAMGNTGLAAAEPQDALYLNPAAMIPIAGYHLSLDYGFASSEKLDLESFGLSIIENTAGGFPPVGFGYRRLLAEGDQGSEVTNDLVRLSGALLIAPQISIGLGVSYLMADSNHLDLDLGLLYVPRPDMGIGLVGYNLLNSVDDEASSVEMRRKLGIGYHYILGGFFRFLVDAHYYIDKEEADLGSLDGMLGIESQVLPFVLIRAGYHVSQVMDKSYPTVGLGFRGPRLRINYSFQGDSELPRHSVDLVLPFW